MIFSYTVHFKAVGVCTCIPDLSMDRDVLHAGRLNTVFFSAKVCNRLTLFPDKNVNGLFGYPPPPPFFKY